MTAPNRSARTAVLLLLLASSGAGAQARDPSAAALGTITAGRLAAHVAWLAGDALEGRAPGTRGGRLAAEYIAQRFADAGLRPLGSSYFHEVPLVGWRADSAATRVIAGRGLRGLRLRPHTDAVLWSPVAARSIDLDAPLVFVGHGIHAPEYGWNDYEGDVRGRIVVVLPGEPDVPDGFDGGALTYYGRWSYKVEEAGRRGAAGVLLVHDDRSAGYDWDVVRRSWGGEVLALAADSAAELPRLAGWIGRPAALRLLARAGRSLEALERRARAAPAPPLDLEIPLRVQLRARTRTFQSPNVIAVLRGRHRTRAAEWVVHTAHYDHLGIGAPVEGDSIYNGAYDNASGVAVLLEIAAAFGALQPRPERSLMFVATTAEEAGMLGATWLLRRPPVPVASIVAAVNVDGANLWGETDDIAAVGAERSTLGALFERAAAREGLRSNAERAPAEGYFFRSDQFPFARAGIPALAIEHGLAYRLRAAEWGEEVVGAQLRRTYHAPSDDPGAPIEFRGALQQARVTFRLLESIANRALRPEWYEGARPW